MWCARCRREDPGEGGRPGDGRWTLTEVGVEAAGAMAVVDVQPVRLMLSEYTAPSVWSESGEKLSRDSTTEGRTRRRS